MSQPRDPTAAAHLAVVVTASSADRVSEGLRAGLGLGLRGDPVEVVLTGAAARYGDADGGGDPRIARALATLAELGRPARVVEAAEADAVAARARAVEVWSEGRPESHQRGATRAAPRDLELTGGDTAGGAPALLPLDLCRIEPGSVIRRLFSAGRAVLW